MTESPIHGSVLWYLYSCDEESDLDLAETGQFFVRAEYRS